MGDACARLHQMAPIFPRNLLNMSTSSNCREAIVNAPVIPIPAAVEKAYFQRSSVLGLPRKCLLLRRVPNLRQLTGPAKSWRIMMLDFRKGGSLLEPLPTVAAQ
jgi:hypothetical protein